MSRDSFHSLSSLLIEQNLARDADVAFLYNEKVSFSRFYADVCCLVEHLTGCDESKWAICTKDSYYFAVAFIALCHSRKEIVVPGNHKPSALLELSPNFDAILYDSLVQSDIGLDGVNLESFIFDPSSNLSLPAFDAENISITLYTSGSGGQPKAIKKTLLLFENELRQLHKIWGNFLQGKSFYSTVSHQHIYGLLFRVLYPLATGSAFDRRALEYPEQIINFSDKGAVLVSSPALIKRITLEEVIFYKSGYSAVFSSGGPLSFKAA